MNEKISIVIPNWNGKHFLRDCFNSLKKQTYQNFEIIIVDNGSSDGSVAHISRFKKNLPEIKIIEFEKNYGFAKAANAGIKIAKGKFIFLLNNDTELEENCLKNVLLSARYSKADIFACKILYFNNREIICDVGDDYSIYGYALQRGKWEKDFGQFDNEKFVFSACAGAALYRKEIFNSIGYFDEDYFAYLEDIDFCFRAQLIGYKCKYVSSAVVFHVDGGTSKKLNDFTNYYSYRNNLYLLAKNMPFFLLLIFFPLIFIYQFRQLIFSLREKKFRIFVKAYRDFFRNLPQISKKRKVIQKSRNVSSIYVLSILSKKYPFHIIKSFFSVVKKLLKYILINTFGIKFLKKNQIKHG